MKDFSRALILPLMALSALLCLIFLLRYWGYQQQHEPVSHAQFDSFRVYSVTDRGEALFRSICFSDFVQRWVTCKDPHPFIQSADLGSSQSLEELLRTRPDQYLILNLVTPDVQAL